MAKGKGVQKRETKKPKKAVKAAAGSPPKDAKKK